MGDLPEPTEARASASTRRASSFGSDAGGEPEREPELGAHPSTGWLDKRESLITPWCAAVLIAPRVVLTSAACVQHDVSSLRFGLGVPGDPAADIVQVEEVAYLEGDARLAALRLAEPVTRVAAARPARRSKDAAGAGVVQGVAMTFGPRGEPSDRWIWEGALADGDALVAEVGEGAPPSCHGDNGAGVYDARGDLVGLVVAARGAGTCADAFELASTDTVLDEATDAVGGDEVALY